MLQQVCENLHNYFVKAEYSGNYVIADGVFSPTVSLKDGQRFWLVGSDLNDGVYTYHPSGINNDDDDGEAMLQDEQFTGTICAMAVPQDVLALAAEIKAWQDKNKDILDSPYSSENVIGVYSYQKAGGGSGGSGVAGWQTQFSARLKRWRKVCV